jgi:DNA replication protein DnaC
MYLAHCGVGLTYARMDWEDLGLDHDHPARRAALEYVADSASLIHAGLGLIFTGPSGTGKTLMSTLILKSLLAQGHGGYFARFTEAIDLFMSGWRDPVEKREFHRRIKNSAVLVLDDVGREKRGRHETSAETVEEVLRHRVARAKPTIITTNKSADVLSGDYGIATFLSGYSTVVEFKNDPFFDRLQARALEEKRLGLTRPIVV